MEILRMSEGHFSEIEFDWSGHFSEKTSGQFSELKLNYL